MPESEGLYFNEYLSNYRVKASKDYRLALIGDAQVDILSVKDFSKQPSIPKIPIIIGSLNAYNSLIKVVDAAWGPPELTPETGSLIAVLDSVGYVIVYQFIVAGYWPVYINLNITLNWKRSKEGKIYTIEWSPIQPGSTYSLIAIGAKLESKSYITICLIGSKSIKRVYNFECDDVICKLEWSPSWLTEVTISLTVTSPTALSAYFMNFGRRTGANIIYRYKRNIRDNLIFIY